jgi:hypothetical protein
MEVIYLPCFKASVHGHCVLKALQSNNQCVYCRKNLDPQDIINCTPQQKASTGEVNISQTTTLPEIKAPPEANMPQKDISANMNPPNILGEPPVQDEDINMVRNLFRMKRGVCPAFQLLAKTMTMDYCLHLHAPLVLMRTSISQCLKRSAPTQ